MQFPEVAYISWAKSQPQVDYNLARSGIEPCPASLLGLTASDLATWLPPSCGHEPLRSAIADRYRVAASQVFPLSGGTSYANWIACTTILDGFPSAAEVIVERPTYEPLLRIPQALGHRIRRLHRRGDSSFSIDLDEFKSLVSSKTRLAIVSNLHNPSGVRTELTTLRAMAEILGRVNAYLLVDEVYLECLFRETTESCVYAGPNVVSTNSLTKAYGLDGLRAGWILGPSQIIARAERINDLIANSSVAPGEQMALAAFRHLDVVGQRARTVLDPNLEIVRAFLARESRLKAVPPQGGTIVFARLPSGISAGQLNDHLIKHYSTLVVPGLFFEAPEYVRIGFAIDPKLVERGLSNISSALDDLGESN